MRSTWKQATWIWIPPRVVTASCPALPPSADDYVNGFAIDLSGNM